MGKRIRVLLVEDSEDDALLVLGELRRNGYEPVFERVETHDDMLEALTRQRWDVIICDYSMPGFNAMNALELLRKIKLDLPFILVSGTIGEEIAVEALKTGADDYIMKGNMARLTPAIERELREFEDKRRIEQMEEQLRKLYRAIEQSPASVVITDTKGRIEYVNPKFSEITGYSAEDAIGNSPRMLNSGRHPRDYYKELWDTVKSGREWRGVFCNKKKGGELYWESASISSVKDGMGAITHYVAVKEDITEQKHMEEAIQALVKSMVGVTGQEFFDRITDCMCEWLGTEYSFIGIIGDGNIARALSMKVDGEYVSGYVYDLCGTPCEDVAKSGYCVYPEGVSKLFPHDEALIEMKAEGYVGISLKDKNNKNIGLLWTASRHKLYLPSRMAEVMEIIATKAGAEIERSRAEEEIKASLREKEVLLKEIHHRVKNNMQVISSLLNLQAESVDDERILRILKESRDRVKSMALVHEKLYQTKDLSGIDFGEYTRSLTARLLHSYANETNGVHLKIDMEEVFMAVNKAIPCGLIINEFLSNSLKHAFPKCKTFMKNKAEDNNDVATCVSEDKSIIRLSMRKIVDRGSRNACLGKSRGQSESKFETLNPKSRSRAAVNADIIELILNDNGTGLPAGFDFRNTKTLGLELVNTLVAQLGGAIEHVKSEVGTEFKITFRV